MSSGVSSKTAPMSDAMVPPLKPPAALPCITCTAAVFLRARTRDMPLKCQIWLTTRTSPAPHQRRSLLHAHQHKFGCTCACTSQLPACHRLMIDASLFPAGSTKIHRAIACKLPPAGPHMRKIKAGGAPVELLLNGLRDQVGAQVGGDGVKAAHVHNLHAVLDCPVMVLLDCAHSPRYLACMKRQ